MAIWQFTFYWVPRDAVEKLHGADALVLASFAPVDIETWDENAETPNYWLGRNPKSYGPAIEALLPSRKSWSADALMFGDEEGDGVELWDDDVRLRLDIRQFNEPLARALVSLAARDDLKLAMGQTGRLIPPTYDKLAREISNSLALKFALDPVGTLRMIGREQQ
ncbi:MAG: hypothetical protein ABUS57_06110 [Pseudomonadota bacterium]